MMVSATQQNQMLNALQQNPVILVTMEAQHETPHLKEKDARPCFPRQGNCSADSLVCDACKQLDAIHSSANLNHVFVQQRRQVGIVSTKISRAFLL